MIDILLVTHYNIVYNHSRNEIFSHLSLHSRHHLRHHESSFLFIPNLIFLWFHSKDSKFRIHMRFEEFHDLSLFVLKILKVIEWIISQLNFLKLTLFRLYFSLYHPLSNSQLQFIFQMTKENVALEYFIFSQNQFYYLGHFNDSIFCLSH